MFLRHDWSPVVAPPRVSGFVAAARYLTIVPFPGRPYGGTEALGAAAPWFPIVGLGIGVVLVVTDWITTLLSPALLAASTAPLQ